MEIKKVISLFMTFALSAGLLTDCKAAWKIDLTKAEKESVTAVQTSIPAPTEENTAGIPFSYGDLPNLKFWFGSGAGGWRTALTVHADGSFTGEYSDFDVSERYLCDFTGQFTEPQKVNDYTYSVRIEDLELAVEPGQEEIKDEIRIIYSEPYGLDAAGEFLFYMPGAPVEELPEGYRYWMQGYERFDDTQLPFYGLYNVNAEMGFSSHAAINDELFYVSNQASDLERRLEEESLPQSEITKITSQIYQLWDDELNVIWSQLKETLDPSAMDNLRTEQREWIAYKEAEVEKAGSEFEGGSLRPMVEYGRATELTEERVYELAEYLR